MDDRDGRIYDPKKYEELLTQLKPESNVLKHFHEMLIPPTEKQLARIPPRVGRNEPCPCGSGKKFKHCCFSMEPMDGSTFGLPDIDKS